MQFQRHISLTTIKNIIPGLSFSVFLALLARWLHKQILIGGQNVISEVIIVITIAILIKSFLGLPAFLNEGVEFCLKKLLKIAIILLGLSFSFYTVISTSLAALLIIIVCIISAILIMFCFARIFKINHSLALLIGVGTAICGASAIVATAPAIGAEKDDVTYSVATITLFGVIAIFVYPAIGSLLCLNEMQFGVWVGSAIHETAQVLAAGFIYGEVAGRIATVVKLTRVVLLVPIILVLGYLHLRQQKSNSIQFKVDWKAAFPWFILGFLLLALARTGFDYALVGGLYEQAWKATVNYSNLSAKFLIIVAMAGVGLLSDFSRIKALGFFPLIAGLACSLLVAGLSFGLILLLLSSTM